MSRLLLQTELPTQVSSYTDFWLGLTTGQDIDHWSGGLTTG